MLRSVALVVALLLSAVPAWADIDLAMGRVGLESFSAPLAEHGEWLESAQYGSVWRPAGVSPSWRPYFNGRWMWTEEGWFWASEEPWGWATYHYGRWAADPESGWVWVPGPEWAPAWVEWRVGERIAGWRPLPPRAERRRAVVREHWIFVPLDSFANVLVSKVALSAAEIRAGWPLARPVPGGLFGGPARALVEQRRGSALDPVMPMVLASPYEAARLRGLAIHRPERVRRAPADLPLR